MVTGVVPPISDSVISVMASTTIPIASPNNAPILPRWYANTITGVSAVSHRIVAIAGRASGNRKALTTGRNRATSAATPWAFGIGWLACNSGRYIGAQHDPAGLVRQAR